MGKELEVKVLDINVENIDKKLLELGAKKENKFFKIYSYKMDTSQTCKDSEGLGICDSSKESDNFEEHIRLRDEGDKITLAYKKKTNNEIDGTQEIEFEVSSFKDSAKFLSKFKFNGIFYQERKRIDYTLWEIIFSIDFWPKIPAFLEIESNSIKNVEKGLTLLNLKGCDVGNLSIIKVYNKYNLNLHSFKELKF